ncbi:MFS transporter [Oligoflexus tunisiensis]|uniref:MFS transporter n=1 Tax=Oligoflexus tunisiensis TaxID=708132 RepID=UPI000AED9BCD|nr:MFS transporter [Oligoflexus tunisiensis]
MSPHSLTRQLFSVNVIVSALGYFVDSYDIVLFSVVRMASLRSLGVPEDQLLNVGVHLMNLQMGGMLLGGILFGILGDKRGRLSVLFGSIFLYSAANLLNAFVTSTEAYGVLRFIAGVGLAGELGAAVTLVGETMSKETRGYGTCLIAGCGVSGAALAAYVGGAFTWQTSYVIGGLMGFLLLLVRIRVTESTIFLQMRRTLVPRGRFFSLFTDRRRALRFLQCILIGVPIAFIFSIFLTLSPELGKALGATSPIVPGKVIMFYYIGQMIGDLSSGITSQILRSRRKAVAGFLSVSMLLIVHFLFTRGRDSSYYYALYFALGISFGFWALFITIAAEQFGTNLRATVATTVPNLVRGLIVIVTSIFQVLRPSVGVVNSALILGIGCALLAYSALLFIPETFGKDLNYIET